MKTVYNDPNKVIVKSMLKKTTDDWRPSVHNTKTGGKDVCIALLLNRETNKVAIRVFGGSNWGMQRGFEASDMAIAQDLYAKISKIENVTIKRLREFGLKTTGKRGWDDKWDFPIFERTPNVFENALNVMALIRDYFNEPNIYNIEIRREELNVELRRRGMTELLEIFDKPSKMKLN